MICVDQDGRGDPGQREMRPEPLMSSHPDPERRPPQHCFWTSHRHCVVCQLNPCDVQPEEEDEQCPEPGRTEPSNRSHLLSQRSFGPLLYAMSSPTDRSVRLSQSVFHPYHFLAQFTWNSSSVPEKYFNANFSANSSCPIRKNT